MIERRSITITITIICIDKFGGLKAAAPPWHNGAFASGQIAAVRSRTKVSFILTTGKSAVIRPPAGLISSH